MSKFIAVSLLLCALCGCGKKDVVNAPADDATLGCANSLRHIDDAKKSWAEKSGAALTATPTEDDLLPYFRKGMPRCPGGGTYTIGTVSELPKCSIAAHNEYFSAHLAPPPQ
jgi:hypothetical protein